MSEDDISKRLKETASQCGEALDAWQANKKDGKAREALQEAVHELRKVSSRLEIELAISERDEMAQKPIPTPSHRDSKKQVGDRNDNRGNRAPKEGGANKPKSSGPRKSSSKKASDGNDG